MTEDKGIFTLFGEMLEKLNLPEEEEEQVLTQLGSALAVNFVSRLLDHVPEEEREPLRVRIKEDGARGFEDVIKQAGERISKETFDELMKESAAEVLQAFLDQS